MKHEPQSLSRPVKAPARKWIRPLSAAVALSAAATITACSSSSSSGPATGATSATTSALGAPDKATGSTVLVGWANLQGGATTYPELTVAAQAAADYANNYLGGLHGHVIKLDTCNDIGDAASPTRCANQFIDDHDVAVAEGQVTDDATYVSDLAAAKIPWISIAATSAAAFTSPYSFVFNPSSLAFVATAVGYAQQKHTVLQFLGDNVPAVSSVYSSFVQPMAAKAGVKTGLTLITPAAPDPTPQVVAALSGKPGALVLFLDSALCATVPPAVVANVPSGGQRPTMFMSASCAGTTGVAADVFTGVHVPDYYGPTGTDAETKLYEAVMATYAPKQSTTGDVAAGYEPMLDFIRAVDASPVKLAGTSEQVTADLRSAKNVPLALELGATATCDGEVFKAFPSNCSAVTVTKTIESSSTSSYSVVNVAKIVNAAVP